MRRRDFIALVGGAAGWPLTARAQRLAPPIVGFLRSEPVTDQSDLVREFRAGLKDAGFVDGENVAVEIQSAEGQVAKLPGLVSGMIRKPVAVIIGNIAAAQAAKSATTTVPIIFVVGNDPVALGLVSSINRPGGNVTGLFFLGGVVSAKRMELLRELVPQKKPIGVVLDPGTNGEQERADLQAAIQANGQDFIFLNASTDAAFDAAFATFAERGVGAVFVGSGAFTLTHRKHIVALAEHYRLPASYADLQIVIDGGLMSYGASISDAYHQAGGYAARILRGEKPADLPVIQSTKFGLVLNLKTAKLLGLDVPPKVLALADEVIE
jgi:putative tryptophan/tyrosine transport system substrate-binding protein